MSISKMYRVLACGHVDERDRLLGELQHLAIVEVSDINSDRISEDNEISKIIESDSERLQSVKVLLEKMKTYSPEDKVFSRFMTGPALIKRDRYDEIWNSEETLFKIRTGKELFEALEKVDAKRESLKVSMEELSPFRGLDFSFSELRSLWYAEFRVISAEEAVFNEIEKNDKIEIFRAGEKDTALLLFHKSHNREVAEFTGRLNAEFLQVPSSFDNPAESFNELKEKVESVENETIDIEKKIRSFAVSSIQHLSAVKEYGENMLLRRDALMGVDSGRSSFIMKGWIDIDDIPLLHELEKKFSTVECFTEKPEAGENPPIKLKDTKLFSPFQMFVKMYSMPAYGTVDPSRFTAFFFALFLGITLTDAAYGLVLAVLSAAGLILFRRKPDILWITFWGGLFTVAAGLLTGGIAGDLFRNSSPYVSSGQMISFRKYFMWFDPLVDPMMFFRIALALGVIQILSGLAIGFVHDLRIGRYSDAFFDRLTWFFIVGMSVKILLSSKISVDMSLVPYDEPLFTGSYLKYESVLPVFMSLLILFFGGREEKSWPFRIFVGFLKLTVLSGIFSYLGDILSYIRLMALGMVTAGIGMAVNAIAFMSADIPVAGFIITLIILVIGHTFNLAINLIGGFVHSMRLQYVEFFTKFFTGGGRVFRPLSDIEDKIKFQP